MNALRRFFSQFCTVVLVLSPGICRADLNGEMVDFRDGDRTWSYRKGTSHEWTVYIEKSLAGDKKMVADLFAELDKSFAHIKKVVPAEPLAFLRTIPVWVSNEPNYPLRKGEKGVIPFHRSKGWLRGRGMNPHMVPGVHVINPRAVLYEHKVFEWGPMTILHELSHGYHNFHLKLGHPAVRKAYQDAMDSGLYLKVPDRKEPARKVKAYAATNHEEYFAELTEAYFGHNDWFPHNREELKEYDPAGFSMIEDVWKVRTGSKKSGVSFPTRGPPNIVFLLTDDQRWDTLGCYGNEIIHTPHLDALSEGGVTFDRAFVTSAICAPNRACILTGQYAARHGMWQFDQELSAPQLVQTYPAVLKKNGYRTGFIGKYGVGKPPGKEIFDFNKGFPGQGRFLFQQNGKQVHLTSVMASQAEDFIDGCRKDEPFQLSISFKAPHVQDGSGVKSNQFPFDPSPAIANLYRDLEIPLPSTATSALYERWPDFLKHSEARARWATRYWSPVRAQESLKGYYRLISGVDAAVGRIVAKLQSAGFAENTVIIFTSDHGQYLGDYGFAGKWYPHEASIRVPLIVFDPRLPQGRRGARSGDFALSIDLGPTMLDLAGVEPPTTMQGRSFAPVVRGETPGDWRTEYYYEHHFVPRPTWNMSLPRNEGIRTARWKYIQYIDSEPRFEELYDLDVDYAETKNLAADPAQADRMAQFRRQLVQMRQNAR